MTALEVDRGRVLIADQEQQVAEGLRDLLARKYLFHAHSVTSVREAIEELALGSSDVLVMDWLFQQGSAKDLIAFARENCPGTWVIVYSGLRTSDEESMALGADDFVLKESSPVGVRTAVERGVRHARERQRLFARCAWPVSKDDQALARGLAEAIGSRPSNGRCRGLVCADGNIPQAAKIWAAGMHTGGAEAMASVDCSSTPTQAQVEAIFGRADHAPGQPPRLARGLMESLAGGTLCLDSADMASDALQTKVARAVRDGQFRREGSSRDIPADCRLLVTVATEGPGDQAVSRLSPELRELLRDCWVELPALSGLSDGGASLADRMLTAMSGGKRRLGRSTEHVLRSKRFQVGVLGLAAGLMRACHATGNVPEIEAEELGIPLLESALVQCGPEGKLIDPWKTAKGICEAYYLARLLAATGGNVSQAAELFGAGRQALHQAIRRHGINRTDFRRESPPLRSG